MTALVALAVTPPPPDDPPIIPRLVVRVDNTASSPKSSAFGGGGAGIPISLKCVNSTFPLNLISPMLGSENLQALEKK